MDRNNVKFWMEIKTGRYPNVSFGIKSTIQNWLKLSSLKDWASDRSDADWGGSEHHDLHQRQEQRQAAGRRDGPGLLGL